MAFINFNGQLLAEETPIITAANRGLRYGDGLFETMKMLDGNLVLADAHFKRLFHGLGVLGFTFPNYLDPSFLTEQIALVARANGHGQAARIRLCLLRSNGTLAEPVNKAPDYIIESSILPRQHNEWNIAGLSLGVYDATRKSCDALANLKHNNFLPYLLAARHASEHNFDDAIVLNSNGQIAECSIANIFLITDGVVFTPALSEGCVAGIVRQELIGRLLAAGHPVAESAITREALFAADEIFLTNSIYNLRWVSRVGHRYYTNTFTRQIFDTIIQTF